MRFIQNALHQLHNKAMLLHIVTHFMICGYVEAGLEPRYCQDIIKIEAISVV